MAQLAMSIVPPGATFTPTWARLLPSTQAVWGIIPSGRAVTKGSPS